MVNCWNFRYFFLYPLDEIGRFVWVCQYYYHCHEYSSRGSVDSCCNGTSFLNILSGVFYGGTFVGLVALFMSLGGKLAGNNPVILMGALTTAYGIGQVIAPLYAVVLTDWSGNYNYALYVTAVIIIGGIALLFGAKRVLKIHY